MSAAENYHVIEVGGSTLREISEAALDAFAAFFNREVAWSVTRMTTDAEFVELRDGAGAVIGRELVRWHARVEASAHGIQIGAQKHEAAMLFKRLGS